MTERALDERIGGCVSWWIDARVSQWKDGRIAGRMLGWVVTGRMDSGVVHTCDRWIVTWVGVGWMYGC